MQCHGIDPTCALLKSADQRVSKVVYIMQIKQLGSLNVKRESAKPIHVDPLSNNTH